MKLAFTTGNLVRNVDGVARVVYTIVDTLSKKGVQMMGFSQIIPKEQEEALQRFKVPSLPILVHGKYRMAVGAGSVLKKHLKEFQPDVIHVHTPDPLGRAAASYGHKHNIPVIATHHTRFASYLEYYRADFLESFIWSSLRSLYKKCDLVLCPSSQIVEELKEQNITNTVLLPHGVWTDIFNPSKKDPDFKKKHGVEGKTVLLFVSRIVWEKDLKILAQAYKNLENRDDIAFVVAGKGPAQEELQEMMPKAVFAGELSREEVAVAYASSDIFVFPSTSETFGLVVLEAMASNIPVVSVHASGVSDIVTHEETGLLAQPKDAADFTAKITQMLDDKPLQERLRAAGFAYSQTQSWAQVMDRLQQYYQEYIDKKKHA